MRDIEADIEHSIDEDGTLKMNCSVPLTEEEVNEFEKVLPQGSNFLCPTLTENSISYSHEINYSSKLEAKERLENRLRLFAMFVRSRTELTIICNLNLHQ